MLRSRFAVGSAHRSARPAGWRSAARLGLAVAASGSVMTALTLAMPAGASTHQAAVSYSFRTYNNGGDESFNQLLGINRDGVIAGYFGSGARQHPNKGYLLNPPHHQANYQNENFPHAKQTQVTGLNNVGVTVGFWSNQNKANLANNNFGFYAFNGVFHSVIFPTADNSSPPVNQLLGVNDANVAVGFYVNGHGNSRGYEYNIDTNTFSRVIVPGASSVTAAAINNLGNVAGFYTNSTGTHGFLLRRGGTLVTLDVPGATMTQALGVSGLNEVVGSYTDSTGASHGFTWTAAGGFSTVDNPHGVGSTVINGVNNAGDLVGFYTGTVGNTNGFEAMPTP